MSTMTATAASSLVSRLVRGAAAGIAAGIVFIAITMWFADSMGDPARMPLHMIATVVQGDDAMMNGDTNATVGAIVHLVISAGYGTAFEATVSWEVRRQGSDEVVAEGFTDAGANGEFADFADSVDLDPGTYELRAFESSAEDGRPCYARARKA